jgi:hypothetical protein
MAIQDDIPVRSNGQTVDAAWWNVIRQALIDYSIGVHEALTNNPHAVTKTQVGLSNVPNTDATARSSHTGTQLSSTISDFAAAVAALVSSNLKMTFFKTTSNVTNADSVTLTNIPALQFSVASGKSYEIEMVLLYQTSSAQSGLATTFNTIDTAAGSIGASVETQSNGDGTAGQMTGIISTLGDLMIAPSASMADENNICVCRGIFVCTTSGILIPQFRRDGGTGTVTVYPGSLLKLREL